MQDEVLLPPPAKKRSGRGLLFAVLLAFVGGIGLAGWLAWRGDLDAWLPQRQAIAAERDVMAASALPPTAAPRLAPGTSPDAAALPEALAQQPASFAVGNVETRLALLEDRIARLGVEATQASGNAARAEGLLIAFAARRVLAKGGQLGYLEDQLKLRFAGAQPQAVATLTEFSRKPVTIDELYSGLDALTPALAEAAPSEGGWAWVKREFASLVTVRRANSPALDPRDRAQRARMLLTAGRTEEAVGEVQKLPGAEAAQAWIASARRYAAAQQALDVIETTAMLEPRRLQDAAGTAVSQPSPLEIPADEAVAAEAVQAAE